MEVLLSHSRRDWSALSPMIDFPMLCSPALPPGSYRLKLSCSSSEVELPAPVFDVVAGETVPLKVQLEDAK